MPAHVLWTALDHAAKLSRRQGGERKARGVVRGIPDYLFVLPPEGQAAFIELKSATGRLTPEQRVWREYLLRSGAHHAVCRSLDDVCEALASWGVGLKFHVWREYQAGLRG